MKDEFTRMAVVVALKNMFSGGHFNICAVRDSLKALDIKPLPGQMQPLEVLHCINWRDMPANFRDQVMGRVLALFDEGTTFDLSEIDGSIPVNTEKREKVGLLALHRRS